MEIVKNFVVFEGGDGSGTSTQLQLLTEKTAFFPTFEPTDTPTGRLIKSALKKKIDLAPQTLCYLFAADRNEHLYGQGGIIEHTQKGIPVISDRYVVSSLVYQSIECGDYLPNMLNSSFPAPELTIFFDIKSEIALDRVKKRASSDSSSLEIYEYPDFQQKVYSKYLSVLEKYEKEGARVLYIDASKTIQEVADHVWDIISKMPIFK